MRVSTIVAVFCVSLGLTACGGKTDGFVPPKVGSQFDWKYVSSDDVTSETVTVVATGPDFAIFHQPQEDSYFAEFSAIGFSSCSEEEEQPSRKDRAAALAAWPLTVGTDIKWQKGTITIEKKGELDLGEDSVPVFWFIHDYADEFTDNDEFAVSTRHGTVLELHWPENARDYVVSYKSPNAKSTEVKEVKEGYALLDGTDISKLDYCAALLSETEPVTASAD